MKLRDKIKTKHGYFIDLPAISQKDDCRLFIGKGSVGTIKSMVTNKDVVINFEIEFELTKGISLLLDKLNMEDIEEIDIKNKE